MSDPFVQHTVIGYRYLIRPMCQHAEWISHKDARDSFHFIAVNWCGYRLVDVPDIGLAFAPVGVVGTDIILMN